jgi:hypothetical protein
MGFMGCFQRKVVCGLFVCGLVIGSAGCAEEGEPAPCSAVAPDALRICVAQYSEALGDCYAASGAACAEGDAGTAAAIAELEQRFVGRCVDGELGSLSVEALVDRMSSSCESQASSLAWRAYGGPQGAAWETADEAGRACLSAAHDAGAQVLDASLRAIDTCLAGDACDAAAVESERAAAASSAQASIEAACAEPALAELVAVDAPTFVERAARQVDCIAAAGHWDEGPLSLRCGPSNAQFDAPRGEWTRVDVDGDEWGTICGDGSPYSFHVRLAAEGEPLDHVVIGLQGGGVCLFEEDCAARMESDPGLFTAMDDEPVDISGGIMSDDPEENPFANWTRVYLPYCNQDVFAGGGVDEELGDLVLPRHGSVNLRAAVQMVRDVLWKKLDEAGGDGFRADKVVALFGGWSAGGYGTLYNYHWFLDDLQWPRTSAFPDAGLALDNGEVVGVSGLGIVKIPAWGMQPNLPPYCFGGGCAEGETIYEAISPRLKRVPEQQMLMLSNPYDVTQQNDAFFADSPSFINEMRRSFCATRDLPGIQYYFTSVSTESVHVVSLRPALWGGSVDGEAMRDWFWRAVTDADSVEDRVEEADFVTAIPGVDAYPCEVPL